MFEYQNHTKNLTLCIRYIPIHFSTKQQKNIESRGQCFGKVLSLEDLHISLENQLLLEAYFLLTTLITLIRMI